MAIVIKPKIKFDEAAVQSDLEKFTRVYAETAVEAAKKEIVKFAKQQMKEYYEEYDPVYYDPRTNQMLNSSYKPFTTKSGDFYEGGVIINSENTNHKRGSESFTEEKLYDMVWIEGYHGYEKVGYPTSYWRPIKGNPFRPDRLHKIIDKVNSDRFQNKMKEKGMKKAKAQSYSIIKFK